MLSVKPYVCTARHGDRPFEEQHVRHTLAFTCSGSYGYHVRGKRHDLVAGSFLVGQAGDPYTCTHDHHAGGDRCLSIQLDPAVVDELGGTRAWQVGTVPPIAELAMLGRMAEATARGGTDRGVDEVALALCARFIATATGRTSTVTPSPRDRRRAIDAATWIAANSERAITLEDMASRTGLSPFHFLRVFKTTIGVSPHQYLVRTRLAAAAELLAVDPERAITDVALDVGFADLSNFVRTFRRAAGVTPGEFRDRKIFQARRSTTARG
ncbi:MAG: AraC family transcriptional regulator [Kofleriaceae bacterium]